jgi:4a-hydroxytetrahydrobiopterin dehydratase
MAEPDACTPLADERCLACRATQPPIEPTEAARLLAQLPGWAIIEREGIPRLERMYRFSDYSAALAFVQGIGEVAEQERHHPVITLTPRAVTVTWWTHSIRNLHRNDFVMAAKTDRLATSSGPST